MKTIYTRIEGDILLMDNTPGPWWCRRWAGSYLHLSTWDLWSGNVKVRCGVTEADAVLWVAGVTS